MYVVSENDRYGDTDNTTHETLQDALDALAERAYDQEKSTFKLYEAKEISVSIVRGGGEVREAIYGNVKVRA